MAMELRQIIESNKDRLIEDVLKLVSFESVKGEEQEGMPQGEAVHEALKAALEMAEGY